MKTIDTKEADSCHACDSYLQVVWQLCPPGIARIHCHKHSTGRFQYYLHSFKIETLQLNVQVKNAHITHI